MAIWLTRPTGDSAIQDASDEELAIAFEFETLRELDMILELDLLEALLAMDDEAIADFPQSERRMMRFLSEAERRAIRHEHRKFWRRNGIESNRNSPYVYDHGARNSLRQFEFSPKERRDLPARLHQLPAGERKELRKKNPKYARASRSRAKAAARAPAR